MGSTKNKAALKNATQDHPHIHGEHNRASNRAEEDIGSPPYTWGARGSCQSKRPRRRITPIYMGSTRSRNHSLRRVGDHPHIHGEHQLLIRQPVTGLGSPPYTWGAHGLEASSFGCLRITPIYMGSTSAWPPDFGVRKDHPHIHGEHIKRSL